MNGHCFYNQLQWATISSVLPSKVDHQAVRLGLEKTLAQYRTHLDHIKADPKRTLDEDIAAHERFLSASRELIAAYLPDLFPSLDLERQSRERKEITDQLEKLMPTSEFYIAAGKKRRKEVARKGRKPDFWRDHFLKSILDQWMAAGGKMTTSINPENGAATGRTVTFLVAAAAPLYAITPDTARQVVRKLRRLRAEHDKARYYGEI